LGDLLYRYKFLLEAESNNEWSGTSLALLTSTLSEEFMDDMERLSAVPATVVSHETFRAARQERETPKRQAKPRHQDAALQTSFGF